MKKILFILASLFVVASAGADVSNFSYVYEDDGTNRYILFKDAEGRELGKYESEFRLTMHSAVQVQKNGVNFLVTTWLNGAATYNVRVFVPVAHKTLLSGRAYIQEPLCDIGLEGDVPHLNSDEKKIIANRINKQTVFSVLVDNSSLPHYISCQGYK